MRRVFLTMLIFALLCEIAGADIPNPAMFGRPSRPTSFSLKPSENEKDTIILEIIPHSPGRWHYEFQSIDDDGNIGETLTSSDGSYDGEGGPVKAKLTFKKPHRGKNLQYRVEAVFEGEIDTKSNLRIRRGREIFTRIITVSNIQGTVYVFADNTKK